MTDELKAAMAAYDAAYDAVNVKVAGLWLEYNSAQQNGSGQGRAYRAYEDALRERREVILKWDAEIERLGGIVAEVGR